MHDNLISTVSGCSTVNCTPTLSDRIFNFLFSILQENIVHETCPYSQDSKNCAHTEFGLSFEPHQHTELRLVVTR